MYSRCKVCDRTYGLDFLSRFPDEKYCHVCEMEIMICLMEMEELDEVGEENEENIN